MEFQSMKHLEIVKPEDLPQNDGLEALLMEQKILNNRIYPLALKNLRFDDAAFDSQRNIIFTEDQREVMTKEYLLAIIRECNEALDMINSKFWKVTKKPVDVVELKYEFIDIQHFVNSLYDIWNMKRDEVLGMFYAKVKENHRRNASGY